jgi:Mg2+/Co2+ transporter CorB
MNTESNRMRLFITDSLPATELMTFGIYIYFRVLHKSYAKLHPDQILYNMYFVVYAVPYP